ncbi:Bidirectional sugar transporter SWEET13 [Ananas comosus]|uniref:Bidirectional sugar transporter SWEET n=1 Tax=Ananas comosus TaxID=4615 RepID=A0A199USE2_ANACO|nr:Bidirectional sugar transporter SWEET13 [Ananas comosus]
MLVIRIENPLATGVGLIGNVLSFLVILAPLPTFYRVYKKKSTEGFHSTPYVVALFSAMLWFYYALLTTDVLLFTINALGSVIESIYLVMYIAYAHKKARAFTLKLILLLDVGFYGCVVLITVLFLRGPLRVKIMGWICASFATAVFIAPLSIIRQVIRTKSVEFMPFTLSLFLTLSAVAWFCYGLMLKDSYIALPNVVGVLFGLAQMLLYFIYMNGKKETPVSEITDQDKNPATLANPNADIEMNKESIGVTTPEVESSMSVAGKNEA